MGRFARLRPQRQRAHQTATRPAAGRDHDTDEHNTDEQNTDNLGTDDLDGAEHRSVGRPVQVLLAIGIDGQGPLASSIELANKARIGSLTTEEAVARVARATILCGAAGGLITGAGGIWAAPVAVPVNVVEFYVQAARMVGAIAILRGHDISDAHVRKAVLETLVRAQTDSPLVKAISATGQGAVTRRLIHLVPSGVVLLANKGIGFRLQGVMTQRLFRRRFGRGVPFIGGTVIAIRDAWVMRRIAEQARLEFPATPYPPSRVTKS